MDQSTAGLIATIEAFDLDERSAADPFSKRLARENAWSELYARCVIREYKRFLVLAVTAPHVVTPSDPVDQAWHLHLLYSARYREFCARVLGRTLDHGPSSGGPVELRHFTSAYEQTLASYLELFGEPAPEDIWPPVAERFGPGRLARRVSDAEYWVLRKPRFWGWLEARLPLQKLTWSKLAWLGAFCIGCGFSVSSHISGHEFLLGYVVLWFLCLTVACAAKLLAAPDAEAEGTIPALEPYELLQLAQGPHVAIDGALIALIAQHALVFDDQTSQFQIVGALPDGATELERRVFLELEQSSDRSATAFRAKAPELSRETSAHLLALGLMTSGKERLPFLIALAAPALGLIRIMSRLGSDKPVRGLIFLCVVAVLVALFFRAKVERTARGNAILEKTRAEHRGASATELLHAGLVPLSIALYGIAAVGLTEASSWPGWLARPAASNQSSSDGGCGGGGCGGGGCGGGGCGGGGCGGGGCGGCGGCGG